MQREKLWILFKDFVPEVPHEENQSKQDQRVYPAVLKCVPDATAAVELGEESDGDQVNLGQTEKHSSLVKMLPGALLRIGVQRSPFCQRFRDWVGDR